MPSPDEIKRAMDLLRKHSPNTSFSLENGPLSAAIVSAVCEALQTPARMSEDEILQRARRAAATGARLRGQTTLARGYEKGERDHLPTVKSAARALRDLDKPLVDPITEKLEALSPFAGSALQNLLRKAYDMGVADRAAR